MKIPKEFKRISGWSDYWVSPKGEVGSSKRVEFRVLKPVLNETGYARVYLANGPTKVTQRIHRLVAQAFLENPKNYLEVNHKNNVKTDNRVENLEWCTRGMNMRHAAKYGTLGVRGERHWHAMLSEKHIRKIREFYATGRYTQTLLGILFGVRQGHIGDIVNRRSWKHT